MTTITVVKHLNIVNDTSFGLAASDVLFPEYRLQFQCSKEALSDSIIPTITLPTHAGSYSVIFNLLLVDLSWNSCRLEGNTYSLLETERLLELGEAAEGKKAMETQMLLNHKDAIELLVEQADEVGFNRYTILNLHALLSNNLLADPQTCGRLRAVPVMIGGSVYHPLEIPQLINECFEQILTLASEIKDPFEQAFFAMVHFPYLQPFLDVNKRDTAHQMAEWSETEIPSSDQSRFIEVVETELSALHEGNFARYRLRPLNLWVGEKFGVKRT